MYLFLCRVRVGIMNQGSCVARKTQVTRTRSGATPMRLTSRILSTVSQMTQQRMRREARSWPCSCEMAMILVAKFSQIKLGIAFPRRARTAGRALITTGGYKQVKQASRHQEPGGKRSKEWKEERKSQTELAAKVRLGALHLSDLVGKRVLGFIQCYTGTRLTTAVQPPVNRTAGLLGYFKPPFSGNSSSACTS